MPKEIKVTEYQSIRLPPEQLAPEQAEFLWHRHHHQVVVEPPSFKTEGKWQLTAQGWIGSIYVPPQLMISLAPKLPIHNLFLMISHAHKLENVLSQLDVGCLHTLPGYLDALAGMLARRIRQQFKKGLYQSYRETVAASPYIRGQIQLDRMGNASPDSDVICRYEDLSADNTENQVLVWTLHSIIHSNVCSEETRRAVLSAMNDLLPTVTLRQCDIADLDQIVFHRQNQPYRSLTVLCRLFLAHLAPAHHIGDQRSPSFLISSAHLFERFVAVWLQSNLDDRYVVSVQDRHRIGHHDRLHFAIDMTIYDTKLEQICMVLDTKYKIPDGLPSTADIAQVVAYAEAAGAPEAVLLYPTQLSQTLDAYVGRVRVRALAFELDGDLTAAGETLVDGLLNR